jgi:hypothetical protein
VAPDVHIARPVLGFARPMMPESPFVATPTPPPGQERAASVLGRLRTPRIKRTLATVLRERGALSMPHAVEVALDICDALSTAHANGVVHGQLGLGCVRLAFTPESGPRDVEIFTLEVDAEDSLAVPVAPFLEPERPGGARRVDQRSDVWALGALLHTMLTGVAPADASMGASAELLLESAPRSLAAVIESCLASDPESRPTGADEIAERIASFATWPPDQFARIGARRDKRAAAERVRRQLEQRGLGNLPSVLDKLDDAALARAQRPTTESLSSLLHKNARRSTEAAMERLMNAVHEGIDEARVEHAGRLPSLVDFDDEDEDVLPTVVKEEQADEHRASVAAVVSPLTVVPVVLDEPLLSTPPPMTAMTATEATASRARLRTIATAVGAVLAIVVGAGSLGYALSARPAAATTTSNATSTTTGADVSAAAGAAAAHPAIPVVAASALPEAPAITPASLPEAKP